MNTETVLVSPTVAQKYSTVFQSRLEKHRTETFSRHWWRSGYGMRSHPTEKLDYIKILTYYNLYLYLYSYFFISLPSKFLTKPLRVLENKVNKTNKQYRVSHGKMYFFNFQLFRVRYQNIFYKFKPFEGSTICS